MSSSHPRTTAEPPDLLAAIAARRDRAAFAQLFALFAPKLTSYFLRGGLERAVAEELAQDVMLTVWRRADSYRAELGGPATWIFTIARNRRIDHFRRQGRSAEVTLTGDGDQAAREPAHDPVPAQERTPYLKGALQRLSPEQLEILTLAFIEQKPHSAIAAERRLPLGTVKSKIRRALLRLRELLEERG